jgi:hypothetical protein
MSERRNLAALICMLLSIDAVTAAEQAPPGDRIGQNVANLSNDRFRVREQATLDLIAIGEPALPSLQGLLNSKDQEVRRRAQTAIRTIQNRLRNEALIRAPKLRLKYEARPLDEALADLSQKSGLPFVLDAKANKNPKMSITLDTGDVPYWEAIEKFLSAAGLVEVVEQPAPPQPNQNMVYRQRQQKPPDQRIRLVESKVAAPVSTASIVRVKLLPREAPGNSVTKGSNEINFVLDVTSAPTLSWQGCLSVDIRKAVDDRGVALAQSYLRRSGTSPEEMLYAQNFQGQAFINGRIFIQGNVNGRQVFFADDGSMINPNRPDPKHVPVTLLGRESGSKMLKELQGVITGQVQTAPQALATIANIRKAAGKDKVENGEYHLEVVDRTTDKSGYVHLRFRLQMPMQVDANDIQFGGQFGGLIVDQVNGNGQANIVFEYANGKAIKNSALNVLEQSFNGEVQITEYLAVVPTDKSEEPVKLVVSGRKSEFIEVPFVLKNVPLP